MVEYFYTQIKKTMGNNIELILSIIIMTYLIITLAICAVYDEEPASAIFWVLFPIIWIIKRLKKTSKDSESINNDYDKKRLSRKFASLKFWTPELIEWIGNTSDPVKLAVASCLINCHEWPAWLPGKPIDYRGKCNDDDDIESFYTVEIYRMLKNKCEIISPGIYQYIWLTKYYRTYVYCK